LDKNLILGYYRCKSARKGRHFETSVYRAILCNDSLVKKLNELERTEDMYRGLVDHTRQSSTYLLYFLFSGHEPIYFIENKEKTLRASYYRGTQIFDYMD
jgi:hypothetical protein